MTAAPTTQASSPIRRRSAKPLRELFTSERSRWSLVVIVIWVEVGALFSESIERDTFWETRAGLENLSGTPLVRPDTWSWSATGLWYPNSPAWNVVLGIGWHILGWWGLAILAIATCGALLTFLLLAARRAGARALPSLIVAASLTLVGSSSLSGRATATVMMLLAVSALFAGWWAGVSVRLHSHLSLSGAFAAGLALSLVGNWVHLSFMPASAVVACSWAVAWWFAPGLRRGLRLSMAATATVGLFLGCVLSPYGIALTFARSAVVAEACQGLITEWWSLPSAAANDSPALVVVMLIGLASAMISCVALVIRIRRRGTIVAGEVALIALTVISIPFSVAGLTAARFVFPGLFMALPGMAVASTELVTRIRRRTLRARPDPESRLVIYTSGRALSQALVLSVLVMVPFTIVSIASNVVPAEVPLARGLPAGCHLFSDPGTAGPVLLSRPDVKVWIDGRADFYGRDHLLEFKAIADSKAPIPEGTTCIILPTRTEKGSPLRMAMALDRSHDWRQVATTGHLVLWLPTKTH